ncbi:MAG: hypothetical protein ACHQKZ_03740 [Solirubrobacterales bacterium]|jgi:hypothetical protein
MIPADHREMLDRVGYLKIEGFIAPELRVRLAERLQALLVAEGDRAGSEFKQEPGARRLANLVDKGPSSRSASPFPSSSRTSGT